MEQIINQLISMWLYDINVMSNKWMYIPFLIPALFYFAFVLLKWLFITIPIWLPLTVVINSFRRNN